MVGSLGNLWGGASKSGTRIYIPHLNCTACACTMATPEECIISHEKCGHISRGYVHGARRIFSKCCCFLFVESRFAHRWSIFRAHFFGGHPGGCLIVLKLVYVSPPVLSIQQWAMTRVNMCSVSKGVNAMDEKLAPFFAVFGIERPISTRQYFILTLSLLFLPALIRSRVK